MRKKCVRYLELLCQLAAEAIKHGQVKGAKVCIEAEEGIKTEGERMTVCAACDRLWGGFTTKNKLPQTDAEKSLTGVKAIFEHSGSIGT